MNIRKVDITDKSEWARMRNSLWPGSLDERLKIIDRYFSNNEVDIIEVFVLERSTIKLGGFIEINVRNYAEGSTSPKVPYIEGWYIDKDLRGSGHGKQLIDAAEKWAIDHGYNELASDSELENAHSIAAHKALGFKEAERIVCFIKKLK